MRLLTGFFCFHFSAKKIALYIGNFSCSRVCSVKTLVQISEYRQSIPLKSTGLFEVQSQCDEDLHHKLPVTMLDSKYQICFLFFCLTAVTGFARIFPLSLFLGDFFNGIAKNNTSVEDLSFFVLIRDYFFFLVQLANIFPYLDMSFSSLIYILALIGRREMNQQFNLFCSCMLSSYSVSIQASPCSFPRHSPLGIVSFELCLV